MTKPAIWLDPNWRRMDELFSDADQAELGRDYVVHWGRDEAAPDGQLETVLSEITALVAGMPKVDRAVLDAAPHLKAVVEVSGSFPDTIDYEACAAAGRQAALTRRWRATRRRSRAPAGARSPRPRR